MPNFNILFEELSAELTEEEGKTGSEGCVSEFASSSDDSKKIILVHNDCGFTGTEPLSNIGFLRIC